jgi:hypothetical protein
MHAQRSARSLPEFASHAQRASMTTSARQATAVVVFLVLAALANCEKRDPTNAVPPPALLEEGGERFSNASVVYTP